MLRTLCVLASAWYAQAASLPVITTFTPNPAQIAQGQSSTLRWNVIGATSLKMNPGGAVTGTSLVVTPTVSTTYTLTATNATGSRSAKVMVNVGGPPLITAFTAAPTQIRSGQSSTLSWSVSGATSLRIDPAPGVVRGTSLKVSPAMTTTYTPSATNGYGTRTATVTVSLGTLPVITSFTATPAKVAAGQTSTLAWAVTGATSLRIDPGVGVVTGTSITFSPASSATYTLTATNAVGAVSARVAVTVTTGSPPVIGSFVANPSTAGPGVTATLRWSTTGATNLTIDHGVGTVTGTSVNVSPTAATVYTLTASNSAGSVTATAKVNYIPLKTVTAQLFYSEHALFMIPGPGQVTWTGSSWASVFSAANINSYVATLKSLFHDDFFFVVVAANNLNPNSVPNVLTYRHLADGIGMKTITGVGVPNICRYNIGGGTIGDAAFGVLDHEIGHNWGVFLGLEVGNGHWLANSTATGQMASTYSDDGYLTVKQISGDPVNGFTWTAADNIKKNESEIFSPQDLYVMGLNATFPDLYVLDSPVYNADHTVSHSGVTKYDQVWVEQKNGVRVPDYRSSDKKLRMAVVYIARDIAEVLSVYQPIERSVSQFVNGEQIDTKTFRFQVPFLVATEYRASLDARLADLDGNRTPTLNLDGSPDVLSGDGNASVPFTAPDADGGAPVVSCVPASANCSVSGGSVRLQGLPSGANFFTIKAEDAGGKKTFTHFVVTVP